jgi:hypothetical protein
MENNSSTIEMLLKRAEDYTRTTVELMKLQAVDKSADVVSSLLSRMIVSIVFVLFAFLVNIGLSFWVGELLGKIYFGFLVVSAFYLLIAFILYIVRDKVLKTPIRNFIIIRMLKKN